MEPVRQGRSWMTSLKRALAPLQPLATMISTASVMSGIVPLMQAALRTGSPTVMIFGLAFTSMMAFTIALSLADIASGFPNVKGGLIEYSRRLAPPKLSRISSWMVGWLHFCALVTGATSYAFSFALFGTTVIELSTGIVPSRSVTVFIRILVSILYGTISAFNITVDFASVMWHIIGPILILMTIATSVKNPPSARWVFTHFENQTGWSSPFYVVLLGLTQGAFTTAGYDTPIHTLHNIKNAAWRVPREILSGLLASFITGELLILTLLFGVNNIDAILNPTISGTASVEIFVHLVGSIGVACILLIFMGTFFFSGQDVLIACSKIGHELAMKDVFPKSEFLSHVGPRGQPARMAWLCTSISCGIGILYLGNKTILQTLTSAVAIELNLVYCAPVALRLFYPSPIRFHPGSFSLGRWGRLLAAVAVSWSVICVFTFSLPNYHPISIDNMNYASVLFLSTIGLALGYWFYSARHWFEMDRPPASSPENKSENEAKINTEQRKLPVAVISEGCLQEKDLEEIESWLDRLERDLHLMK
ncbi:amino acid/polyamine transporter I [Gamsiella multidivaricata]|uniref:amino acid/polyamine transporter I n=1 Tax=Gamsiella multidivaricata TaxID=101098 RepID=UPI00221FC4DC|nr:amino acid/polyamine transporter I [Gamsiella multidivaricata]KAI7828621.1 amino acid/polyamine transporter I [Gamsiella multidivaricata]